MEEGYCKECGGFMEYIGSREGIGNRIHGYLCSHCGNHEESDTLVFNEEE